MADLLTRVRIASFDCILRCGCFTEVTVMRSSMVSVEIILICRLKLFLHIRMISTIRISVMVTTGETGTVTSHAYPTYARTQPAPIRPGAQMCDVTCSTLHVNTCGSINYTRDALSAAALSLICRSSRRRSRSQRPSRHHSTYS